jgi:hypothetical protein
VSENRKTTAVLASEDALHKHDGWGSYQAHQVLAEYVMEEVLIYGGPRAQPDPKIISDSLMDKFDRVRFGDEFSKLKKELEAELRTNYSDEQLADLLEKVRTGTYHSGRRWYREGNK